MEKTKKLKSLRLKIDKIDESILQLLHDRFTLLNEVKLVKVSSKLPLKDLKREKELLDKAILLYGQHESKNFIIEVYRSILNSCLKQLKS